MKTIAIIEGHAVIASESGAVVMYESKAAIDDDGTGPAHGDPDEQTHTSLKPDLNADTDKYIVVPPAIIDGVPGVVMGCHAQVHYQGKITDAVVGDVGPHTKLGEISIACAKALGIPWSPTTGGVDGGVTYLVFPGVPALVDGKQYALQPS